jgi:very-short-patch-repair endonuclease
MGRVSPRATGEACPPDRPSSVTRYGALRFWNFDVDANMPGVVDAIMLELDRKTP